MPKKSKMTEPANPEQAKPEFFSQKVINATSASKTNSKKSTAVPQTRDIRKQIASIYENAEPLTSLQPKSSKKTKILTFIIFVLAFLSAISWTGFFMFGRGSSFDENKLILSAQTKSTPLVGEEFSYQIKIKNQGHTTLNNVSLSLRYPQGFEFISAEPISSGAENKEWEIGSLLSGEETKINISGVIWDNAGTENNLQMSLNYRPGDLTAEFQKVVIFKTQLAAPEITLEAELPAEGNSGEEIPLNINLTNKTEKELSNLELFLNLPAGFKNSSSTWKDNKFSLISLPLASSTLSSALLLPTAAIIPGIQQIKIDLKTKKGGRSYLLQSLTKEINVSKSNLSLNLAANGEKEKQAVNFGDKVTFTLAYENTGNTELKNITLRLILDTPSTDNKSLFDWTGIIDKYDGEITAEQTSPQIRRAIITWTKAQIPALGNIKPQDKNSWEVTLPLKQKGYLNLSKLTEFKTAVFAEAILDGPDTSIKTNLQSNNLELILNSDLNLSSAATFKESKNLPLQVGKIIYDTKSIYNVVWDLTNNLHELTNLQLTATLPENVDWEKNSTATAGEVTYDVTTKQVVWKLNRLPTSFPKVTISFDLGLKSTESDGGKELVLLDKTRAEAEDKVTGENVLFWKDPIIILP